MFVRHRTTVNKELRDHHAGVRQEWSRMDQIAALNATGPDNGHWNMDPLTLSRS